MKKIIFFLSGILLVSCAGTKKLAVSERLLVGVAPFAYKADNAEFAGIVSGLSDAVTSELAKTGQFRMVERSRIDAVLKELGLGQTGVLDSTTVAQIGKQLGVKALIVGSVFAVSVEDEWRSVKFAEKTTRKAHIQVEARLVDVETGEIYASATAMGDSKTAEKHAFGGKIGELATKESVVQKALQELSLQLARDLAKSYSKR